jgi:hypothetical protein
MSPVSEFKSDPVAVEVNDQSALDKLRRGFILRDMPGMLVGDVTVRTVITRLPDGTYTIRCWYLSGREPTSSGTAMHSPRDLGYLTQEGFDALHPHETHNCDIKLELRATLLRQ